ncbi:MAG: GNAT family N-acetyltransferase [Clostridiales bacterium]|nr:GNAT family N-acetyltransferase [Clostridiales bacterium]
MIRPASPADASRIAEILIFVKRMNYRRIFQDDQVSFGEMQVLPLALSYQNDPELLQGLYVYDDGFVKGLVDIKGRQIRQLYVDSFFAGQGIGGQLIRFAVEQHGCDQLWVLEKNTDAIRFYQRHGFAFTGKRQLQEGTSQWLAEMERIHLSCIPAGYPL